MVQSSTEKIYGMALNFSHRPIFSPHLAEDNLVSPIRIANGYLVEGILDKNGDGFRKPWHSNREVSDCFDYGRDRDERGGSQQESVSNDIIDLLPSDPFGMDISTTFTAITGWLEDLEVDYGGYGTGEIGTSQGNHELFAGLNFIWNNAMRFQTLTGKACLDDRSDIACGFGGCSKEKQVAQPSCNCLFGPSRLAEDVLTFGNEDVCGANCRGDELREFNGSCSGSDEATPHEAVHLALAYVGLKDLFSAERACRSLRDTIQGDPLLWRSIYVDQPLNERITDDILLQLTARAQGSLQCLSLVECPRITDDGLKRVLESNPRLTKVSISCLLDLYMNPVITMFMYMYCLMEDSVHSCIIPYTTCQSMKLFIILFYLETSVHHLFLRITHLLAFFGQ